MIRSDKQSISYYQVYLQHLNRRPLLTKAITAGILSSLNEIIASILSGNFKTVKLRITSDVQVKIKHVLTKKVLLMLIYGMLVNAPLSHYLYKILNKLYKPPLSRNLKVAQLATSLVTITPTLSTVFITYLALINNKFSTTRSLVDTVRSSLRANLMPVIRSSMITSTVCTTFAQNFLDPELWVVFFNVVYFVLGTIQNTRIKSKNTK